MIMSTITLVDRVDETLQWLDVEQYERGAAVVPIAEARSRLSDMRLTPEQMLQRGQARQRSLAATAQALDEERKRIERLEPVAVAGHAVAAAYLNPDEYAGTMMKRFRDLLDAHQATTPSPAPVRHVVVALDQLQWRRAVCNIAEALAYGPPTAEQLAALRTVLANRPADES